MVEKRDKPTVRQVYALAAELCDRMGEEFPESRGDASELMPVRVSTAETIARSVRCGDRPR